MDVEIAEDRVVARGGGLAIGEEKDGVDTDVAIDEA